MKIARTYVFVFLPITSAWSAHVSSAPDHNIGSNGSSAPGEHNENLQWRLRHRQAPDTGALRSDLLWTWFVDNRRSAV